MLTNRSKLFMILFSILYWMFVAFYFVTTRYTGLGKYAPPDLHFGVLVVYSAVVGFSIGLLFGLFPLNDLLLFKKRKSFLTVVSIGTSCYILFFAIVIFLASLYGNSFQFALSYVISPNGLAVLFHLSIASLLYHFILQINKKFGPGILFEYTFGKYFTPKEEERVFMFLDLKSSTNIAEKLEHLTYSHMVQDCFAELTTPLVNSKAQVYQYIGDEVIVSWKMNRYFSASSCYEFFYAFQERLERRKEYYLLNYGVQPQFKAGLHCGKVTVAEIGEIKTEIAYHGDVLNTASRIQGLCNKFQKELLVSESFLQHIPKKDHDHVSFVANAALRGKEATIKIFTIADPLRMENTKPSLSFHTNRVNDNEKPNNYSSSNSIYNGLSQLCEKS